LSFDEIERVIRIFSKLGVRRVRITGGEPLLRKNLPVLVRRLKQLGSLEDISLSTNAGRLSKSAADLKSAGIDRINVSLDTLDQKRFKNINGGKLEKVIDGLMVAKEVGFYPVKINTLVMKDINDDEIFDIVNFCMKHGFTLRFIETMPIGTTGVEASKHYVNLTTVKQKLSHRYNLIPTVTSHGGGPARYVRVEGTDCLIGFITPISQHFCENCNRVRLSADGNLLLCLGQNDMVPLRPLLRDGITDKQLEEVILNAIFHKPRRHEFQTHPDQIVRFMSVTGG